MPDTTPNLAIPYPTSGDRIADYPTTARNAALAVDTAISQVARPITLAITVDRSWDIEILTAIQIGKLVMVEFKATAHAAWPMKPGDAWPLFTLTNPAPRPTHLAHVNVIGPINPTCFVNTDGVVRTYTYTSGTSSKTPYYANLWWLVA